MSDIKENQVNKVTRRKVLKGTAIAGAAAAVGPWIISPKALASSGEVNVTMWSDYIPKPVIEDFTKATGIKVNYKDLGSNEELINQMKATKGAGVDICSPTNNRSGQWVELGLLAPIDYNKLPNVKNMNPAMLKVGPEGGIPSYGNIWDKEVEGKTMIRPHSGMLGAGLYMETIGKLNPGDVWKAYKSEDEMRPVWEKITKFCIENKSQIKLFWNDTDSQKNGLLNDGVIVGQTWDGPVLSMKSAGEPVTYQAPKEGAMAWVDSMALSSAASNLEQAYELMNYVMAAEVGGKSINTHGYNSAVLGADAHTDANYKKNFAEAYPGDALKNLNPWPAEPQWYADIRTEYRNKFVNAKS